jgi:magnesium-transporting ATPase (P-type)
MALSERTQNLLLNAIAVSPIMQRFAFPGAAGLVLAAVGAWQDIPWLTIAGLILAAPVLWCYFVIMVICPIVLLFEKLFSGPPKRHWEE